MEIDDGLKERLKAWRKERRWSQADVVYELSKIGVDIVKQSYSSYETGRIRPSRATAVAIAKIYGKSIDHLLLADNGVDSERVQNVRTWMRQVPEEDQAFIEVMVRNLYETKVLKNNNEQKSH